MSVEPSTHLRPKLQDSPVRLKRRGRASLDFAAAVVRMLGPTSRKVGEGLRASGIADDMLSENLDERSAQIEAVAERLPEFHVAKLLREWYGEHHGRLAIEAFEEIADELRDDLDRAREGSTTLERRDDRAAPDYWKDEWIHRTQGGWDGHAYMGFIHGELIHRGLVAKAMAPADIFAQRRAVAVRVAERSPRAILEVGCGSGQFTLALADACGEAAITACDLSLRQLEQAQRVLNARGHAVRLVRCAAESTDLASDSFDTVTSYALLHELPAQATEAILAEALRVLRPGGELLFADVPPYERLGKLLQWQVDYGARYEGEPFWREAATLDVAGILERIGFVGIERRGMTEGPYPFPFITRAMKSVR